MQGFSNADDRQGAMWSKLVQSQCCLISVVNTGCKKVQLSAKKCFSNLLKNVSSCRKRTRNHRFHYHTVDIDESVVVRVRYLSCVWKQCK